jgi:hypothetical protein
VVGGGGGRRRISIVGNRHFYAVVSFQGHDTRYNVLSTLQIKTRRQLESVPNNCTVRSQVCRRMVMVNHFVSSIEASVCQRMRFSLAVGKTWAGPRELARVHF